MEQLPYSTLVPGEVAHYNVALISAGGIEQEGLILLSLLSSVIDIYCGFTQS